MSVKETEFKQDILYSVNKIMKDYFLAHQKEIQQEVNSLFKQAEFYESLLQRIISIMQEEVRTQLMTADLHKYVKGVVRSHVQDEIRPIIKNIIEETLKSMEKKLAIDYERAKELTLSIEEEIKSAVRTADVSAESEKMIRTALLRRIEGTRKVMDNKYIGGTNKK